MNSVYNMTIRHILYFPLMVECGCASDFMAWWVRHHPLHEPQLWTYDNLVAQSSVQFQLKPTRFPKAVTQVKRVTWEPLQNAVGLHCGWLTEPKAPRILHVCCQQYRLLWNRLSSCFLIGISRLVNGSLLNKSEMVLPGVESADTGADC